MRLTKIPTVFLFAPLAVSAIAVAALVGLPHSQRVWQLGAWSLAVAAFVLLVALPSTAYSLVKDVSARTWPRSIAFAMGVLYMALLVFGVLF